MKMTGGFSQSGPRMSQQGDVDDRRTDSNLAALRRTEVPRMGKVALQLRVGPGPGPESP